jgi:hypothetical protein
MINSTKYKIAKTIREYRVNYNGWDLLIPVGSTVANKTAGGNNDAYRFLQGTNEFAKLVTGYPNSILAHDLTHCGLNIPAEYCEPWPEEVMPVTPDEDATQSLVRDWQYEVANGDTVLGLVEWRKHKQESEDRE